MKHLVIACWCVACICVVFSCKKNKDEDAPAPCCVTVTPKPADIPYDTTGIQGVFSAHVLYDSSTTRKVSSLYFTSWFTSNIRPHFTDSLTISANGYELTGAGSLFNRILDQYVSKTQFNADTPISWVMTGSKDKSFTYANVDSFPTCKAVIPDTVSRGHNDIFVFGPDVVTNADSIQLKMIYGTSDGSTDTAIFHAGNVADRVFLDSTFIATVANKSADVYISVFNHRRLSIKGYTYLFIREYTLGGSTWFK